MYRLVLDLHNITRWIVIITALVALLRAWQGWRGQQVWSDQDRRWGLFFTIAIDIQLLLGLLLFFVLSPHTKTALQDIGKAMADEHTRFFLVEHLPLMIIAAILAHIGAARSKKASLAAARYKTAFIFYGISLLLILLAIPWPFLAYGRPLLPGL